ncbi:MAG: DNA-3-methyladenine glycosylase [Bacteroidetes bacterium]|nr:DNA-3-methyladenine glycosylase [Bacteroidota bacterium]
MSILTISFYLREDVVTIARELLGKTLYTQFDGILTGGIISETEAYAGATDRASHAYGHKRTDRTEVMYNRGGTAYIYLCYGVHSLFNVVTNAKDIPHAVLIRAIQPVTGIETMLLRSGKATIDKSFGTGPGKVSKLLGIHYSDTGMDLTVKPASLAGKGIWIEDEGRTINPDSIITGPRFGVEYAGKDAMLPYRFRTSK